MSNTNLCNSTVTFTVTTAGLVQYTTCCGLTLSQYFNPGVQTIYECLVNGSVTTNITSGATIECLIYKEECVCVQPTPTPSPTPCECSNGANFPTKYSIIQYTDCCGVVKTLTFGKSENPVSITAYINDCVKVGSIIDITNGGESYVDANYNECCTSSCENTPTPTPTVAECMSVIVFSLDCEGSVQYTDCCGVLSDVYTYSSAGTYTINSDCVRVGSLSAITGFNPFNVQYVGSPCSLPCPTPTPVPSAETLCITISSTTFNNGTINLESLAYDGIYNNHPYYILSSNGINFGTIYWSLNYNTWVHQEFFSTTSGGTGQMYGVNIIQGDTFFPIPTNFQTVSSTLYSIYNISFGLCPTPTPTPTPTTNINPTPTPTPSATPITGCAESVTFTAVAQPIYDPPTQNTICFCVGADGIPVTCGPRHFLGAYNGKGYYGVLDVGGYILGYVFWIILNNRWEF